MSQVSCDISLYRGKWHQASKDSWSDFIHEALESAFAGCGKLREVTFGDIEDSPDGCRRVVRVLADWWGDDDAEVCGCVIHEALVDHLEPEFDSQVEVDVAIVSVGFGGGCHDYWHDDVEFGDAC